MSEQLLLLFRGKLINAKTHMSQRLNLIAILVRNPLLLFTILTNDVPSITSATINVLNEDIPTSSPQSPVATGMIK